MKKIMFSTERAEKLTQSDKGLYYNQDELLKQSSGQSSTESVSAPKSASRSKTPVEERDNDDASKTWQKLSGHSITAGKRLQEKFDKAVTCRFCQGNVELLENVGNKNGLGSTWMLQCQKESCPLHKRKSRVFEINRASVLVSIVAVMQRLQSY